MSALEATIREIVRDELRRALAEHRDADTLLTVAEAAEVARVAAGTVRRWVREGRLSAAGSGRLTRIRRADLEGLLSGSRRARAIAHSPAEQARRDFGGER